jgi:OmcA/MtrC family decaheme c-type cytochrome
VRDPLRIHMRTRITPVTLGRVSICSAVILGSALLISSPSAEFTTRDKAYYMDEKQAAFVRPGLVIDITSGEIANDGTMKVTFKLTDPRGAPLDRTGVVTPGAVSVSFIAAVLPNGQDKFQAYTTRVQTTPASGPRPGQSAIQATGQNNGTFREVTMGEYEYTFSVKAPAGIDRTATHRFGAYGSRNLTAAATGLAEDLGTQYDDDTFDFVPGGGEVQKTRDVIRTETCNNCHHQLAFHGGSRRSVPLCVMCHTDRTFGSTPGASNIDPDTGESIDLSVMAHRIHMGASLPSVKAGDPFQIIGNAQSVNDYSEITFPFGTTSRTGGHMVDCNACHGRDSAVQKDNWLTKPSRAACGSCHDDVNFATGQGHVNLPQLSDNQCSTCHTPQGEVEFDASIKGAHAMPRFSPSLPGTTIEILNVANGTAGSRPTVTFTIKDRKGNPIPANRLETLRVYYAGPTTDYAGFAGEDARQAQCDAKGVCNWTFARAIPDDAKGTFSAYIEGYRTIKILEGTAKEVSQRDVAANPRYYFSVDGSRVTPRRQVVAMEKCNACHGYLAFHGDQRNTVETCVNCHNPNQTDAARRPASQMPAQSVDFRTMIHRLHSMKEMGEHEYTVFGFGSTPNDLTRFGFPGDLRNCDACHVNNSQQLPLRSGLLPVQDLRQAIPTPLPETAACTSCHTSNYAKSHALANTTTLGESCATCHGPNADFSVNRVHAH